MIGRLKQLLSNKEFLFLNGVVLVYSVLILLNSPLRPSHELLFYSSDSVTYYTAGKEVFDLSAQGTSLTRPFLYSFFLYAVNSIGGAWLLFILQFVMWLASANLIYFSLKNFKLRMFGQIVGTTLFVANISLMSYQFHGLTEIISVFLGAWLVFLFSKLFKSGYNTKQILGVIFLLALLTVVKPLFQYPFVFALIIGLILFLIKRKYNLKLFLSITLVVLPVVLQLCLMKIKYNEVKISTISELTFRKYIVAQGIREIEGIEDIEESENMALAMNNSDVKTYMWTNRDVYTQLYLANLKDNITGYGRNLLMPPSYTPKYVDFMSEYNKTNYIAFLVFLPLFLLFCAIDLIKRKLIENWHFLALGFLLYYIIFTSGISFWQAERLTIFSIPFWIVLYLLLIKRVWTFITEREN